MKSFLLFFLACGIAAAGNTTVLFQAGSANPGPFPSDSLTVSDSTQKTGLRVALPAPPECAGNPALGSCANTAMINQLDGFNPNARLTVCFSGPIDLTTVIGAISIVPVAGGAATPINQVIFDPASNCLYAKPEVVLNSHTRYLLGVSNTLRDSSGAAVKAAPAFTSCISGGNGGNSNNQGNNNNNQGNNNHQGNVANVLSSADMSSYCSALQSAVGKIQNQTIVSASLFTTLSATDWLEKARARINSFSTPELVIPAGFPFIFPLSNISSMTWNIDSGPVPSQPLPTNLPGVDSIAFGLFLAPNFLSTSGLAAGSIPYTPTNQPIAAANAIVPVSFHVFLPPQSKMPKDGFPVVIYGHGLGDSQFGAPTYMASTLANLGIATVAIEIVGHGFGTKSTVQIVDKQNFKTTLSTPGRGVLLPGNSNIGPTDGCILGGPLAIRDCSRQTAADLMAFTRTLSDFQGFGLGLNPNKVYYVGQSLGSIYGTLLQSLEPRIRASVINAGGGTAIDLARLALSARPLGDGFLAYTNPALFNVPPAPPAPYFHNYIPVDAFNDNYPYRGAPISNTVVGAIPIQAAFEQAEWIDMSGDALSYAPLLQGKPAAFQFGIGDLEVPNPAESSWVRAARAQSSTWLLHFEVAASIDPSLAGLMMQNVPFPILPHRILSNPTIADPMNANELSIANAEQLQAAHYFLTDGKTLSDPNGYLQGIFAGVKLFQHSPVLPDTLNYFQLTP